MLSKKTNIILKFLFSSILLTFAFFMIRSEVDEYNFKKEMGFYNFYIPMYYPRLATKGLCENCEMKIPKIIHRVWMVFDPLKPDMSAVYKKYDKRLKELHPDWQIMEWDDKSSLEFVKQFYPDFLPTYYSYVIPVQRLDAMRYLLVHHYGGLAIQHSFYVQKNLEPLLRGYEFVVAESNYNKNNISNLNTLIINNNFFAGMPKHPIMTKTIEYLTIRMKIQGQHSDNLWYVFNTTGPLLLSDMLFMYIDKKQDPMVKILDGSYLTPFSNIEKNSEPVWSNCILAPEKCHELYPDFYAFSMSTGAWIKK